MSPTALQWLSLVGIIWLQSVSGTNTNFPAYSSYLKHLLSISQVQLNNLAFASDAGKLLGFVSGIAALHLPLWMVLFIGSTLGFVGYGLQYLFVTNQIASFSYVHVFLLTVLAGNSICWINTVCYVVGIRNFSNYQQVVVGLTTSYQGLSAKVYTVLVDCLYHSAAQRAEGYLLLNSVLPLLVCMVAAALVRDVNCGNGKSINVGFSAMFAITIATGIFVVVASLLKGLSPKGNAIGISLFLLVPLAIPLGQKIRQVWLHEEIKVHSFNKTEEGEDAQVTKVEEEEGCGSTKEEIGVTLMVKRVDFWLYFFVYLCGATLGMVYLNNLGQIAESRGCSFSATSSLVSLSSSFNFFGRLMPSLVDYCLPRSRYNTMSRPASTAALMAPMAGAFFLLVNRANICLYVSTAIIGVCTGAITSISVSTTTELFGAKNFSVNHNVVVANIPVGSLVFGYSAALLYRREAHGWHHGKCIGTRCYRNTFIIWASLCCFGTFLALVLHTRLRNFYSSRRSIQH